MQGDALALGGGVSDGVTETGATADDVELEACPVGRALEACPVGWDGERLAV